jgi:hypothetical protein
MPVLRPKRRLVSVRLSDNEFETLVNASLAKGARSTSDVVRRAICQFLGTSQSLDGETQIQERVDRLESDVARLKRLVEAMASIAKEGA